MSGSLQWAEFSAPNAPPSLKRKYKSQDEWSEQEDYIVGLRRRGMVAKEIMSTLQRERGFTVGLDALKKKLRMWNPKNDTDTTARGNLKVNIRRVDRRRRKTVASPVANMAVESQSLDDLSVPDLAHKTSIVESDKARATGPTFVDAAQVEDPMEVFHDEEFIEELVREDGTDDPVETVVARLVFEADIRGFPEKLTLEILGPDSSGSQCHAQEDIQEVADEMVQRLGWDFENMEIEELIEEDLWMDESGLPGEGGLSLAEESISGDAEDLLVDEDHAKRQSEGSSNTNGYVSIDGLESSVEQDEATEIPRHHSHHAENNGTDISDDAIERLIMWVIKSLPRWWNRRRGETNEQIKAISDIGRTLRKRNRRRVKSVISHWRAIKHKNAASDLFHCREATKMTKALRSEGLIPSWVLGTAYFWQARVLYTYAKLQNDSHLCNRFYKAAFMLLRPISQIPESPLWCLTMLQTSWFRLNYKWHDMRPAALNGLLRLAIDFIKGSFSFSSTQTEKQSENRVRVLGILLEIAALRRQSLPGRYIAVQKVLTNALTKFLGAEHRTTRACVHKLVRMLNDNQQYDESFKLMSELHHQSSQIILTRSNAIDSLLSTLRRLARLSSALERHQEAVLICSHAYFYSKKAYGENSFTSIDIVMLNGIILYRARQYAAGLMIFGRLLQLLEEIDKGDTRNTLGSFSSLRSDLDVWIPSRDSGSRTNSVRPTFRRRRHRTPNVHCYAGGCGLECHHQTFDPASQFEVHSSYQ